MIGKDTLKFIVVALAIGFAPGAIAVETPKAQLQGTMERVMAVTRTFRSEQDFTDNKDRLRQIIMPRFDFSEMARRSLGNHWTGLNGREKEFVEVFVQFAEASYMNAIGSYRGEKMTYGRERIDDNFAEVDTRVVNSSGETPIIYRLHLIGDEWKVYDVVIDGVGLVSNYQSQFGRILKTASIDELMRRLREKGTQG